jgi:hypothetical protein
VYVVGLITLSAAPYIPLVGTAWFGRQGPDRVKVRFPSARRDDDDKEPVISEPDGLVVPLIGRTPSPQKAGPPR